MYSELEKGYPDPGQFKYYVLLTSDNVVSGKDAVHPQEVSGIVLHRFERSADQWVRRYISHQDAALMILAGWRPQQNGPYIHLTKHTSNK